MRRTEIAPILITVLALIGVMVFILSPAVQDYLDPDVFRLTYQFLLIVVLGAGVSVAFQAIAAARDARERRRTFQREVHDALVAGYNDAKRARRLLRARARAEGIRPFIVLQEYDKQLEALSGAQLSIELAVRRIELNRTLFRKADEIVVRLKLVERYLNDVIDEWEDIGPRATTFEAGQPALASLPKLHDFLSHYDDAARFPSQFKQPFKEALRLLESDLAAE